MSLPRTRSFSHTQNFHSASRLAMFVLAPRRGINETDTCLLVDLFTQLKLTGFFSRAHCGDLGHFLVGKLRCLTFTIASSIIGPAILYYLGEYLSEEIDNVVLLSS